MNKRTMYALMMGAGVVLVFTVVGANAFRHANESRSEHDNTQRNLRFCSQFPQKDAKAHFQDVQNTAGLTPEQVKQVRNAPANVIATEAPPAIETEARVYSEALRSGIESSPEATQRVDAWVKANC